MFATGLLRWGYRKAAKPLFFRQDPEYVHDRMTAVGSFLGAHAFTRGIVRGLFDFEHPSLVQDILGIHFSNPVGLAAGFDKNAEMMSILPAVGFGFEEIGSITGEACEGNPKPRLWRLPRSKGLVVHYGLKNEGAEAIAFRLRSMKFLIPTGTSIAKTNSSDTVSVEAGIADYAKAFRAFADIGEYFAINISCPNAFGGEPFLDPARLEALLNELDLISTKKPVFIKLAADLTFAEVDALISVVERHRVHGFILSNLTKNRDNPFLHHQDMERVGGGGISGKPTADLSNKLIAHLYRRVGKRFVIIGVGGIFSAKDAYEKILNGATLVQLITGMIFEGPQLIGEINRGLVELLKRDGFSNISEAVGKNV